MLTVQKYIINGRTKKQPGIPAAGAIYLRMKKGRIIKLWLLLFLVIIFISCNNPLHRTYSPGTYEEDMQAIRKSNKVNDEDLKALANYIILAKLAGNNVTGKSYEDLIDKIKTYRQNNNALSSRDAMEKEAKRARLANFITVNLQNKTFTKKNNKEVFIFTVTLKNTGNQKIKTVTGNLTINDLMEKLIKNLNIFLDEDISPGQTLTKTYTIDYNNADENDRRLRSKDFFDIRIVWNPEKIIFENGRLVE